MLNGRVMGPEAQLDGVANVGIKGSRISVITIYKISGKETIDAKGPVVAPGFIDTRFHSRKERRGPRNPAATRSLNGSRRAGWGV